MDVNIADNCFSGKKNTINTLILVLNTTVRSVQKCFLIFVIHIKIQLDPAHFSSDTNNTEEL